MTIERALLEQNRDQAVFASLSSELALHRGWKTSHRDRSMHTLATHSTPGAVGLASGD